MTLPEPYYKEPARNPVRRPAKAAEAAAAPASAGTTPERMRVVDELAQTDRGLLVRVGIRWFKVAGQPRITVSASGAPQLGGEYRLRPAPAPRAGQMAEGAAAEDPEALRDPLAYLYRLQQNKLAAQAEAVGIEFHRIAAERQEPCLVLMFGHVKGLIPAREAEAGDGLVGLQRLLGQKVEFQVVHVDPEAALALLSRRAARLARRERTEAKVGQVLHAVVRSVLEGGAFVDVGLGVEGFLRAHDYDGRFLADLRRFCHAGDEFEVVVTELAPGRVLVSRAALLPDPWEAVAGRYQQGGFYPARVLAPTPNRAYLMLELPDGTVCYARHPAAGDPVPGTRVTVRLRAVNRERRRLYVSVVGMSA